MSSTDKSFYPQKVLRKMSVLKFKEEIEEIEEPNQLQSVEIKCKEEIETYEKPISFTGESYLCNKCDNHFLNNTNVTEHQRNHTGEKPYQCCQCDNQCGKAFPHTRVLMEHQRTHTEE
ncbi:unnamed protein product, partial [Meganyctiphanes norvegica]